MPAESRHFPAKCARRRESSRFTPNPAKSLIEKADPHGRLVGKNEAAGAADAAAWGLRVVFSPI